MQRDVGAEYVKQLEDELLKHKIENVYLKELRRLRLEEKTLLKKQRESSTASEENLNQKTFSQLLGFRKQHICTGRKDLIEKIQTRNLKIKF